jgi:hypothetical protein
MEWKRAVKKIKVWVDTRLEVSTPHYSSRIPFTDNCCSWLVIVVLLQEIPPMEQVEMTACEEDFDTMGAPAGGNINPPPTVPVEAQEQPSATEASS